MLGTVYRQTRRKYQLRLLAGEEGLTRSLRWLYFSEDIENADFLRGGELMVLTGHSFHGQEGFEDFIRMLVRKNSCGVIVNVGKYILEENISPEILAFCNEHRFPLITMPWKYHLTDILADYSQQIFFRTQEQDRLTYVFQGLLQDGRLHSAEDETRLVANRFSLKGDYLAGVMDCPAQTRGLQREDFLREMRVLAENHLNQTGDRVCAFPYDNRLVLVFHGVAPQAAETQMTELLTLFHRSFPDYGFHGGLGTLFAGVEQIRESYLRASFALLCGMAAGARQMAFQDVGIYQLFFSSRDQVGLESFTQVLKPLEDYDGQNGSQLTETLRLYLASGGSVNQVSEELYCHRNTTNYRIKKIKSLLEADLEDSGLRFRLQLAYHVRDYQALIREK